MCFWLVVYSEKSCTAGPGSRRTFTAVFGVSFLLIGFDLFVLVDEFLSVDLEF